LEVHQRFGPKPRRVRHVQQRANREYWERMSKGGFLLRRGVYQSEAIRDIISNGRACAFECATAIVIVLCNAVPGMIGDKNYDWLFGNLQLCSWEHDSDMPLVTKDGRRETFAGDVLYYSNPDFDPKAPQWQGENVVKMRDNLLFGHGIGIEEEDVTIRHLNNHRKPGSKVSAYLFERTTYPDFYAIIRETQSGAGGMPYVPRWPDGWISRRIGSHTHVITGGPSAQYA